MKKHLVLALVVCIFLGGCRRAEHLTADVLVYPDATDLFPLSTDSVEYQTINQFDAFTKAAEENPDALLVINATDEAITEKIDIDDLKDLLGVTRVLYVYYTDPYERIGFEELWEGESNFAEIAEDMPEEKKKQVIPESGFCVFNVIRTEDGTALYRRNIFLANAQSVDDLKHFSTCDAIMTLTQGN